MSGDRWRPKHDEHGEERSSQKAPAKFVGGVLSLLGKLAELSSWHEFLAGRPPQGEQILVHVARTTVGIEFYDDEGKKRRQARTLTLPIGTRFKSREKSSFSPDLGYELEAELNAHDQVVQQALKAAQPGLPRECTLIAFSGLLQLKPLTL